MPTGTEHTWVGLDLEGNRYRVEKELGRGGMGTVLLARDAKLDMQVVIKVPHAMLLNDPEFAARFRREIRALVTLSHAHIVAITDVGEHDGVPFAVMKYLDGGSLEDRLANGAMSPESLADWLPEIARALDFIHEEGFVHRDIKPANILFDRKGHAYLSDFGIAKAVGDSEPGRKATAALTGTGTVLGTAEYMAPELVMGEAFDHRVDQYALATTVYEVLTGETPFKGPTSAAVMFKHTTEPVPDLRKTNAAVSASVAGAVSRALSKTPEGRFDTCDDFAAAVVAPRSTAASSLAATVNNTAASRGEQAVALTCPQCGRELRPGPQHGGKVIRCPGCQRKLRVSADLLQLTQLGVSSTPTSTTALPAITGLNPTAASIWKPNRNAADVKSQGASLAAWLPWSVGAGVLAVLGLLAIVFLRPGPEPLVVRSDPGEQKVAETTNSIGMRFKLIPAGSFVMGSPGTEVGRDSSDEGPLHKVQLTRPFYLGVYEVTQEQYERVMGTSPSDFKGNQHPIEEVSWNDAVEFCRRLSDFPAERAAGHEYRLPTEAEWEYACRGGSAGAYSFGDSESELSQNAWYAGNSGSTPHPVGEKEANAFGLYDMHGNVWEWCADWYGAYSNGDVVDPQGPSTGSLRVDRGGGWYVTPADVRAANRSRRTPDYRNDYLGFRVARSSIE